MSVISRHQSFEVDLKSQPSSELEAVLARVRILRDELVIAWQERAVVLSKSEQGSLYQEIVGTCELLTNLTRSR